MAVGTPEFLRTKVGAIDRRERESAAYLSWLSHLLRLHQLPAPMANSRYEYVKHFETEDKCLQLTYIGASARYGRRVYGFYSFLCMVYAPLHPYRSSEARARPPSGEPLGESARRLPLFPTVSHCFPLSLTHSTLPFPCKCTSDSD